MSSAVLFYLSTLGVYFAVNTLMVLGLNLQFGLAGVINFSYYLLVAAGGYAAAITAIGPMTSADVGAVTYVGGWTLPWPVPVAVAGLLGAALAVAVAVLAVRRLRSDYLAIATLVVGEGAWTLTGNSTGFLNGWMGLSNVPQPLAGVGNLSPLAYQGLYCLFTLAVAALGLWFSLRLSRSPFGRALRAIRENEATAAACGKWPLGCGRSRKPSSCTPP
jgi:branched-chain amino acid transport system permease protein